MRSSTDDCYTVKRQNYVQLYTRILRVYKFDTLQQLKLVYYCNSVYLSDVSRIVD